MSEIGQRSLNSCVAPCAVLRGHLYDKVTEFFLGRRTTNLSSLAAAVVFHGYQLPVPGEQRLWSHQICDFFQATKSDSLGFARQTGSLVVGKTQSLPSLFFRHLFQDSDFFMQVVDMVLLLTVHPARQRHQHQSENVHLDILTTSEPTKHFEFVYTESVQLPDYQHVLL